MQIFNNILKSIKKLEHHKEVIYTLLIIGLATDCLFLSNKNDFITFGLLILYIIMYYALKMPIKTSYYVALAVLLLMYFEFIFRGASAKAEKTATWVYLMLATGIIQDFIRLRKVNK